MLKTIQVLFVLLLGGTVFISLDFPPPPPPGPIGPYLNGIFPESAPGEGGSWELEDPLPNVPLKAPLRILPYPDSDDLLVLTKRGEIWRVSIEQQSKELFFDISEQAFGRGEAGVTGMALHPSFGDPSAPDKQLLFLFYRTKPAPIQDWSELGFNRLSKFSWNNQTNRFDPATEEILFQQYDRSTWHNGGAMFFGPDGFLYIALGDEGHEFQPSSTQRLNGGLFSGILRIDVDNDPGKSHPIRRQPRPNASPPSGWWDTYSQGYSIPNDNPWLAPDGSILEEFYAIGIRSPYSTSFDAETQTIWMADVGGSAREEISHVEKGDNLQWPYLEGTFESETYKKPDNLIGREKGIYFEYERTLGTCIIGGNVYRGTRFPSLNGKYLFADYTHDKLMALTSTGSQSEPEYEILMSDLSGQPVDVPEKPGITGIYPMDNGEILITVMGENEKVEGKIFRLKQKVAIPEPPAKLSDLGVFSDMANLQVADGILPYTVNAPLWSDRAVKKRWMAVPNDGNFDAADERIQFKDNKEWDFPEGTVFIKHFELPLTEDPEGERARLETRFFIIGEGGRGYGLTYQWNRDGTEAFLLGGGASRDFDINEGGGPSFTQSWDYPSRDQCISCHNANAKYVLGVKTHQLNGELYYDHLGQSMNQLEYLNQTGMFQRDIGEADEYPRAYAIDEEDADLELRIRSYLDANCSSCHRLDGVPLISIDFRFEMALRLQNMINFPTKSHASNPNRLIVQPGSYEDSELYVRDASLGENRMPPLGRNLLDEPYLDALAEWIGNLPDDYGTFNEFLLFPNPSRGGVAVRISDEWSPPFEIRVQTISGRLLRQESSESKSIYLDLFDLPAGTYLLDISNGSKRQVERIIIQ